MAYRPPYYIKKLNLYKEQINLLIHTLIFLWLKHHFSTGLEHKRTHITEVRHADFFIYKYSGGLFEVFL